MVASRRRFQFGILSLLFLILTVAVIVRMWAPRLEFQRMISGSSSTRVESIVILGQGRRVTCDSREAIEYLSSGVARSTRGGRAFAEDYDAGLPSRRYVPYTMQFKMGSGYYSVDCVISAKDCCMYIPFEDSIADGDEPNRRFDFLEPMPTDVVKIIGLLLQDSDSKNGAIENIGVADR